VFTLEISRVTLVKGTSKSFLKDMADYARLLSKMAMALLNSMTTGKYFNNLI